MASPATYRPPRPPYPSSSPTASSSSSSPLPSLPPPPPPSKYDYSESPRGSGDERPWSGGSNGGRDTPDEGRGEGGRSSVGSGEAQPQKSSNPLVDLIESEKRYVEELGAVIRKVAGAWSRANFPPPLLDGMFRAIEGVYKINRSFGSKLKEIGPNPSSPKALGDLLMRWIDDMEPAYTRYASTYLSSFDTWPPVQSNPNLAGILLEVSSQLLPPPPASSPSGDWSLDALFLLPYNRLRYYKKLYARLLKSTQPGRSDHNLLVGANERLTVLLDTVKDRLDYAVGEEPGEGERKSTFENGGEGTRTSVASSGTDSRVSGASLFSANGGRLSNTSASTSFGNLSSSAPGPALLKSIPQAEEAPPPSPGMSQTLIDIERRLDAERTIDLFTMNPRKVRLQIAPPALPFTRKLRRSLDVEIFFTPTSTGEKVHHHRGYIFILSDLFLICERMEPHERAQKVAEADGAQGADLWLCYPPLAGKHLQVAPGPTENHVEVIVMRKETFMLRVENRDMQTKLIREFNDCIEFAANMNLGVQTKIPSPSVGSAPSFQGPGPTSPNFNGALSPTTSSARSSGVQNGGPSPQMASFFANPNGPNSTSNSPSSYHPQFPNGHPVDGGPLPALPPGRANEFRGQRALSQASTYSNGSSTGTHSLPQQMDAMSLGPDGYSRSPQAGQNESPRSPPQYGAPLPPAPRQQLNYDSSPLPSIPSEAPAPPRGASLAPRTSASSSNTSFNQFPPPRSASTSPLPPPPSGQPIVQPYPQRGPSSMGGPPPGSRYASGPLPSSNAPGMGIPRSQSSASSRSQPSLHPSQDHDAPPLPPPHNYLNGGGPQYPNGGPQYPNQGGWPPQGPNGARLSPGGGEGSSPSGPFPPRNFHSASPVNRQPQFDPNYSPHPNGPQSAGGGGGAGSFRSHSAEPLTPVSLPSAGFSQRALSTVDGFALDDPSTRLNSPPPSPKSNVDPATLSGPAIISAAMKCKVFLKKDHASWKSLGAARLKLYHQQSTNVKQVVVESENSGGKMLISTIVLTDGVERVGKTGVAIEISDQGTRTGIVYMIQLRNELSAGGFYDSLLVGTTRGR